MITALDHFVLICPDIEVGTNEYSDLLGMAPAWQANSDGIASAVFAVGNTAIELIAPSGTGDAPSTLRDMVKAGPRLTSLAFRSDDLESDHHAMTRRGLSPSEISDGSSAHSASGETRAWQRFRIPDALMADIKTFVLQPEAPLVTPGSVAGAATGLDHLVINTPNPERAVANYGARLGLRFALDRTAQEWKTRFLFFRLGGLTLEIINRLGEDHDPAGPDSIWGLTWETDDLAAARDRLIEQGRDVSEIRTGRKPGTTVFTVRDGAQGVPTLFIAHTKR